MSRVPEGVCPCSYSGWGAPAGIQLERQQRNRDPKCVPQTRVSQQRQQALAVPISAWISAGTAGKRQEVQAEEEQWGFSLVAANKTI